MKRRCFRWLTTRVVMRMVRVPKAPPHLRFGGSFEFGRVFNPFFLHISHISSLSKSAVHFLGHSLHFPVSSLHSLSFFLSLLHFVNSFWSIWIR